MTTAFREYQRTCPRGGSVNQTSKERTHATGEGSFEGSRLLSLSLDAEVISEHTQGRNLTEVGSGTRGSAEATPAPVEAKKIGERSMFRAAVPVIPLNLPTRRWVKVFRP